MWVLGCGSCRNDVCGASMLINIFTHTLGWATNDKKCGPVPSKDSLDAEIAGCSMMIESLKMGEQVCVCSVGFIAKSLSHMHVAFFVGMLPTPPLRRSVDVKWLGCCCEVRVVRGRRSDLQSVV